MSPLQSKRLLANLIDSCCESVIGIVFHRGRHRWLSRTDPHSTWANDWPRLSACPAIAV